MSEIKKGKERNEEVQILFSNDQFEEALNCFHKSINLNPNNLTCRLNKGKSLQELKRDEEAVVCFNKAIELNPNDSDFYNEKGNYPLNLNQNEESSRRF